jgi:hypothetical protein
MKNGIFISILALSLAAITASDVQADQPQAAECNAIGAVGAGVVQQIVKQGDVSQCEDFTNLFFEFALEGCFGLIATGEINGIFGAGTTQPGGPNEGAAKNLGIAICEAVGACGLCAQAMMAGVCIDLC